MADLRKRKQPLPSGDKAKKHHAGPMQQQCRPALNDKDEFESEEDDSKSNSSSDNGYEEEDEIEEEDKIEEDNEEDEEDEIDDNNNNKDEDGKGAEGVNCQTRPTGPCICCKEKKQQCSLMPINVKTGKADQWMLTARQVFKFHLEQLKGKQPRHGVRVGSNSVVLASRMVGRMKLDSGSSHGHSCLAASVSPSAAESPAPPSTAELPVPPSAELFPAVDAAAEPSVPTPASIPIISPATTPSTVAAIPPTTAATIPPAAATPIPPTPAADSPVPIDNHSPSIALALCRHMSLKRKKLVPYVLVPNPPPSVSSSQKQC
ncbi:hypothetical protein H4582DRAFT_2063418 [Lactarius indigo]|nr:hypothetical protein H4582DRAFT_2063418 [Lactarius indigo]